VPLVRKNGKLEQASWNEAIGLVARRLMEIRDDSGGKAIAGIASPRSTNEDNYVFQKFMRMACRTNNIDSVSRSGFAAAQRYVEDILGQGSTSNMISGLKNSDTILVLGGDPTAVNPILGLAIRAASRNGTKVLVLGNAKGLDRFMSQRLVPPVFKEAEVLELILSKIAEAKGPKGEKPAIDKRITELMGNVKGGSEELDAFGKILLDSGSVSIVTGMDLVQRTDGHRGLFAVAGLTYLLEARLFLLSEKPNEQGLIDMGCVPDTLPGGRPLHFGDFKHTFEDAWKGKIPGDSGLTLMEILKGIPGKNIKALYVYGENPVFNLPDGRSIRESLSSLEFLVVQDIFLTETAEIADVVLPALGWAEKEGTFTNLERRVQLLRKAIDSSSGFDDWKIFADVSGRMGYKMNYSGPEKIMDEIAHVSPLYRDLTFNEIGSGNCLWPYHGEPLRGELKEVPTEKATEKKEYASEFYLVPEKLLFHSGTISRRSSALKKICPEPELRAGEMLSSRLGIQNGETVTVLTEKGSLDVTVSLDDYIKDNRVFLSNNFENKGVLGLLGYSIDSITKAPGIEGCQVKISKARGKHS
jgi:formate dehydrogenase major subunit/formate dehydrogenase alpha subunit